ncbi:hypothetical protein [Anaerosacchariphilus polymeriproducens]|uniref:Uncharacterized protein n=1 Tax=Anaerosacchariphilus polymeriproducens TaxID=1812858 RepID=A0A371AQ95_9FIRM|nr:hypothetical protein [Anaerosacchariphilus polymeriproducens]RDU21755.1 hypothetical protein DWV06_17370 [Anaerosacchariphilus polymeriproducens]
MKKKRIIFISIISIIVFCIINFLFMDNSFIETIFNEKNEIGPYVSITYGINDNTTDSGRRIQYYTYSIDKNKLDLQCSIPFAAQYGTGVVSLENQKLYYSGRAGKNTNDSIIEYDLKTGQTHALENENATYNDIAIVDNHTLLVTAISKKMNVIGLLLLI